MRDIFGLKFWKLYWILTVVKCEFSRFFKADTYCKQTSQQNNIKRIVYRISRLLVKVSFFLRFWEVFYNLTNFLSLQMTSFWQNFAAIPLTHVNHFHVIFFASLSQCGNCCYLVSHIFTKKFVKVTVFLMNYEIVNLTKYSFYENFFIFPLCAP